MGAVPTSLLHFLRARALKEEEEGRFFLLFFYSYKVWCVALVLALRSCLLCFLKSRKCAAMAIIFTGGGEGGRDRGMNTLVRGASCCLWLGYAVDKMSAVG